MKSSDYRFRQLLQQLPEAVLVLSRGRIRFANRAAVRILGASSPAELRDRRYSSFVVSAIASQRGDDCEQQKLRRFDGDIIEVEAVIQRTPHGMQVVLRDHSRFQLSDSPQKQAQVRQAQRLEAVGRLASGIAHDFNNLLTAIHGHAQFLVEDLGDADPSRLDAEEILRSANRASALTRQLLLFSRGQTTDNESIDINEVVTSAERLLRRVIGEHINLIPALDADLWPVRADPSQVEQVLVNLVVNARDAMPQGGDVTIKTANAELVQSYVQRREEVAPGQYVMIAVSDTGVGMDRETQAHIFEPFFTTKAADQGTGLGLSTVFGIVKEAGGHVFVYSELGQGTTIKIYLPRATNEAATRVAEEVLTTNSRGGETILVIEDDVGVRTLAKRVLEARGYDVRVAGSGAEALDVLAKKGSVSLVVTDVTLPDTNGTALVASIKEQLPDCKALLMSGYSSEDVERNGVAVNGTSFIEKPFTPDAFAQKVRDTLDAA